MYVECTARLMFLSGHAYCKTFFSLQRHDTPPVDLVHSGICFNESEFFVQTSHAVCYPKMPYFVYVIREFGRVQPVDLILPARFI